MLFQCADGLRRRRPRGFEQRAGLLYRGSLRALGPVTGEVQEAGEDVSLVARRALRGARAPYRAFVAALVRLAVGLTLATLVVLAAIAALSPKARARLHPRDLAAGRPWTASSADMGLPENGVGPSSNGHLFFHTTVMRNPWVEIDLGGEHILRSVRVENRTDCCQDRALPLNVEVLDGNAWRLVAQRRTAFATWTYDIGPVRARKVRFLHPGTGYFHLRRIAIWGQ